MHIITRFGYNGLQTVYSLQLFVLSPLVCQASTLPGVYGDKFECCYSTTDEPADSVRSLYLW
jgi:hypothetical protein